MIEQNGSGSRSPWHALAARVLPAEPEWRAAEAERRRTLQIAAGETPVLDPADIAPVAGRDAGSAVPMPRRRAPHRFPQARQR